PAQPPPAGDESVADFVRRHFGAEVVERLADPLLSGIYGGAAERLSARAVLGRMVEMEAKHRSLTRGMLAAMKARAQGQSGKAAPALFTSLRGGMQQLVEALAGTLEGSSVRTDTRVAGVLRCGAQWDLRYAAAESPPNSDW